MADHSYTPFKRSNASVVGQSVTRLEDLPLVTGKGRFINNLSFPNQLYMRVVRSNFAHGKIVKIHTEDALAIPGVVAVWTSEDIAGMGPIDFRDPAADALQPYRQPLLATGRVRYVGEPVALVFGEDAYGVEDAADLVTAEIDELPVVLDATASPGEFDTGISTEALLIKKSYGGVTEAFNTAHAVVAGEFVIGRHTGMPLECRGAIGRYDTATDTLELWGAAKVPHRNRETLARYFSRDPLKVNLYEGHVGGGFGVRGELYPEDFLVCIAAMRLGRPVKWIEDRREHMMATNHSRQQHHTVRAAVDAAGRIRALSDEFFLDQGAYIRTHGTRVAELTIGMLPGVYDVPAYEAIGHVRLTNKTGCGTYRSPGRYESTFVRERLLDLIAAKLGIDRVEVRRRNLLRTEDMPHTRPLSVLGVDVRLNSGDYGGLLEAALIKFGWDKVQEELSLRRKNGELVGAGIAMFLEKSGLGPSDAAVVTVGSDGAIEVVTGGASVGQGFETAMAQICAETLGVDYRSIRVVHGQTNRIRHGIGAHATRATVMTGSAVHVAAANVRTKALAHAATVLQAGAADLDIVDGIITRRDAPQGPSISLADVARHLTAVDPAGPTAGLSCEGIFYADHMAYPYGVHMAIVKVDRGTGVIAIERYFVANDVGRAINPMLIDGQITGGAAQGIGGALYEEFLYDASGQPLAVTFADYMVPTALEVPFIEVMITEDAPSPLNPLGVKGAGEGGCAGVGGAIASALDDAIGVPGAITRLPVTPQSMRAILSRVESQASPPHSNTGRA